MDASARTALATDFLAFLDARIARKQEERAASEGLRNRDLLKTELAELYAIREAFTRIFAGTLRD